MTDATEHNPTDRFPTVGRTVVLVSALFVIALGILASPGEWITSSAIAYLCVCGFLGTELIWGSKWARWVIGVLLLLWLAQDLIAGPRYNFIGHLIHVLEGLLGGMLLFNGQVGRYLSIRRSDTARRWKRLRKCTRAVLALVAISVLVADGVSVFRSSN